MGYYRGDGTNYYRGDYYRGDPFIGALVGGAVGRLAGAAGRAIGRAVRGRAGRAVRAAAREAVPSTVGGALGYALGQRSPTMPALGPLEEEGGLLPFGKKKGKKAAGMRTYRRMNPLNPRALKRALRRAEGFEKFAKRTVNAMYRVIDGRKVRTYKKTRRAS